MLVETICLNAERNVTLTAYIPAEGNIGLYESGRPAVLILPGGAYRICSDEEGEPVALAYLRAGYCAFVLRYSVREHYRWPRPLEDYEQAMEIIRNETERWKVLPGKIAVAGFSAGGHLASAAATVSANRPDAVIMGYACVKQDTLDTFGDIPETLSRVDKTVPPTFLFAACDDKAVPISNTTDWAAALAKCGVPFECHIYYCGGHGFSVADASVSGDLSALCGRVPHWVEDSVGFLADVFGTPEREPLKVNFSKRADPDRDAVFLGLDNTIGHLMKNGEAREILLRKFPRLGEDSPAVRAGYAFSLRRVAGASGWDGTLLEDLEKELSVVLNRRD